jgi:3'(2'), 5'-bisphosphate nucleotidase
MLPPPQNEPLEVCAEMDMQQPEIRFALETVAKAAKLAERVRTGMAMMNMTKSDFSPVTVGDFAIQALVGHALAQTFPDDKLVGEEDAAGLRVSDGAEMCAVITKFVAKLVPDATPDAVCDWIDRGNAEASGRYWTLDPIDGTKGYMRGGQYAVALALVEEGVVQVGVLGCPNLATDFSTDGEELGVLAFAARGQGAWAVPLDTWDSPPARISVSDCRDSTAARMMRSFEASHTNTGQIDGIADKLGVAAEPVRMDSQAKYAVLAAGGGEIMLRLLSPDRPDYKEKIWDQAAGLIVLEEAGGRISDMHGQPLDFSTGRMLLNNTGLCATNGHLHEQTLAAIAAVCR